METSSRSLAARFVRGIGVVEIPFDRFVKLMPSYPYEFHWVRTTHNSGDAITFLSTLTFPATRHVAFPVNEQFTVLINNGRNGSDYGDYVYWTPRHFHSRFARIISASRREWTNGKDREVLEYNAQIFELYDPKGELIRCVHCMDDGGRWTFHATGSPHPVESTFPYNARKKRDRFTAQHLAQLTQAFGFPVVSESNFQSAGQFALYGCKPTSADNTACSIEEADDPAFGYYQRGLGWVKHMGTHATSVIADFERCVHLNSSYSSKVKAYLEEAYRRIRSSL